MESLFSRNNSCELGFSESVRVNSYAVQYHMANLARFLQEVSYFLTVFCIWFEFIDLVQGHLEITQFARKCERLNTIQAFAFRGVVINSHNAKVEHIFEGRPRASENPKGKVIACAFYRSRFAGDLRVYLIIQWRLLSRLCSQ